MSQIKYFPDWQQLVVFGPGGPQPTILVADEKIKIIMAGLEPGQIIPEHPEATAIYYFLTGNGWMTVDGERTPVAAGMSIFMPAGASRGLEAETRLAFMATRIA